MTGPKAYAPECVPYLSLPLLHCYATVFKAISTDLRIHSFMYLIFCAYYSRK